MKLKITVHGVAYEVDVEVLEASDEMMKSGTPLPPAPRPQAPAAGAPVPPPPAMSGPAPTASSSGVASPIAGTVLEVKCKPGDKVTQGDCLLVIEAMKMETAIAAPGDGVVKAVNVAAGDSVRESQNLVDFE